jgi:hypothetical protein
LTLGDVYHIDEQSGFLQILSWWTFWRRLHYSLHARESILQENLSKGSVDNSSLRLLIFLPTEFSFSGTQVALSQRGMIGLAKALMGLAVDC